MHFSFLKLSSFPFWDTMLILQPHLLTFWVGAPPPWASPIFPAPIPASNASHRSCSLYINGVWISISRPRLNPEFQTLISNCLLKDSHKCHILLVAKTEFIIFLSISVSEMPSSIQVQVRKFGCFLNPYSSSWTRVNLRDSLFWMCHMSLPLQALPAQATLLGQCSENPFPSNRLSTVFSAWWIFLRQSILHTVSWELL